MNVKKYALAMVMVVLLAAGYSQSSQAAPVLCNSLSTFQQLIDQSGATGGCTIDDKLFNDFTFASVGLLADLTPVPGIPASSITFVLASTNEGFNFTFILNAGTVVVTNDIRLGYDVTCIGATFDCIVSAEVSITGGGSDGGVGRADENICFGGPCGTADTSLHVSTSGITGAEVKFPGQHIVGFDKDINADCFASGGPTCSVSISGLINTVDQTTPEPATLLLFGAGLAGLGLFRRRKA